MLDVERTEDGNQLNEKTKCASVKIELSEDDPPEIEENGMKQSMIQVGKNAVEKRSNAKKRGQGKQLQQQKRKSICINAQIRSAHDLP